MHSQLFGWLGGSVAQGRRRIDFEGVWYDGRDMTRRSFFQTCISAAGAIACAARAGAEARQPLTFTLTIAQHHRAMSMCRDDGYSNCSYHPRIERLLHIRSPAETRTAPAPTAIRATTLLGDAFA